MKGLSDGQVTYLEPVLAPLSIESFILYEGMYTATRSSFSIHSSIEMKKKAHL